MTPRDRPVYKLVFLFILAPIGAAVTVSALLLFGVEAHSVFYAGFAFKSWLKTLGIAAPNAVGVLATVFIWWIVIVAIGLMWERSRRPGKSEMRDQRP
ncbi:MAG: hypothetical protein QOC81_904 [Thermoanaerobaculia bacterium]|nr:hypothetical protein [Thermoanaerobaculia bacterium]